MVAYGISGFVDGFFKGRQIRNDWQDRKDNKERQKRFDEMRFEQDRREREAHDRRMRVFDRQDSDWERARGDDDYYRDLNRRAWEASQGVGGELGLPSADAPQVDAGGVPVQAPMPTTRPQVAPAGPQAPTSIAPAQGVAMALGIDPRVVPQGSRAADLMARTMPPDQMPTKPQGPDVPPPVIPSRAAALELGVDPRFVMPPMSSAADAMARTMPPDRMAQPPADQQPARPEPPTRAAAADPGISYEEWKAMPRSERERRGYPTSVIGGELYFDRFSVGMGADPQPKLPKDREAAKQQYELDSAARKSFAHLSNEGMLSAEDRALARERFGLPEVNASPSGPQLPQRAMSAPPPRSERPLQSRAPASASPTDKALSKAAVDGIAGAPPPVADAATFGVNAMGVPAGKQPTEAQYERGSKAALDRYMEVGAPMILEGMLARGDFDKAQKFMEFMDSVEGKQGMKDWSSAAAAITMGDLDRFGKHVIKAWNREGYFPDGTTLLEDKSGWTYDAQGNRIGARLVFKDAATGNTFEQIYDSPDDLVNLGITLLEPSKAFDVYYERQARAAEAARGIAEKQQARIDADEKTVIEMAQKMVEASKGLDGLPTVKMDEAIQRSIAILGGMRGYGADPAYSGAQDAEPDLLRR